MGKLEICPICGKKIVWENRGYGQIAVCSKRCEMLEKEFFDGLKPTNQTLGEKERG